MQREFDEGQYHVVVRARPEYRPTAPGQIIDGYRTSATITRIDGTAVYQSYLNYQINEEGIYLQQDGAFTEIEKAARKAIEDGFPDA